MCLSRGLREGQQPHTEKHLRGRLGKPPGLLHYRNGVPTLSCFTLCGTFPDSLAPW